MYLLTLCSWKSYRSMLLNEFEYSFTFFSVSVLAEQEKIQLLQQNELYMQKVTKSSFDGQHDSSLHSTFQTPVFI